MTIGAWAACAALAGQVRLKTGDGVTIAGDEFGTGPKGVLLVHDEARSRADWTAFAEKLATGGFHVVTIDLRGHGASMIPSALTDADWPAMTGDIDAGVAWLRSRGATEVHVVGARTGATLALAAAAANAQIDDLVLLTPALSTHGVKVSAVLPAYPRPVMVAVSNEDPLAVKTATYISDNATGPKRLDLFPAAGVGAVMLNKVPDLENLITAWMNGAFRATEGGIASKEAALKAGEVEEIETTGTRLEERNK